MRRRLNGNIDFVTIWYVVHGIVILNVLHIDRWNGTIIVLTIFEFESAIYLQNGHKTQTNEWMKAETIACSSSLTWFWLTIFDRIRLSKLFSALFRVWQVFGVGEIARNMGNSDREPAFVWSTMVFSFSNSCKSTKSSGFISGLS